MSAENWPAADQTAIAPAAPRGAPGAADYDAILAAVMETDRGRWFLAEYASRNRRSDTAEVLAAIDRLAARHAASLAAQQPPEKSQDEDGAVIERLRAELADMASAIARNRTEVAPPSPGHDIRGIPEATEFDAVVRTGERAIADIEAAAKQIQEVAWAMREQGMESGFCDRLDTYATEICTACAFQDLTGQRTRKIIHVLRYLEARIQAMNGICSAAGPATQATATAATSDAAAGADEREHVEIEEPIAQPPLDAARAIDTLPQEPTASAVVELETADHAASSAAQLAPTTPPAPPLFETTQVERADQEVIATLEVAPTVTTGMIEGPAGSFSIFAGRPAEAETRRAPEAVHSVGVEQPEAPPQAVEALPEEPDAPLQQAHSPFQEPEAPVQVAEAAPQEPEVFPEGTVALPEPLATAGLSPVNDVNPLVANLRAFAANLMAEFRKDSERGDAAPAAIAETAPVAAAEEPPPAGIALPTAAAPKLGDPPQRPAADPLPAPAPAPRRKTDIAENLFTDVMALTDEERIALFT